MTEVIGNNTITYNGELFNTEPFPNGDAQLKAGKDFLVLRPVLTMGIEYPRNEISFIMRYATHHTMEPGNSIRFYQLVQQEEPISTS